MIVSPPGARNLHQILQGASGQRFSWAYLGQSVEAFERANNLFVDRGVYVDTAVSFHGTTQKLRNSYLTYLYEIGRGLGSLRWWITSLSYRSPYDSQTFLRSCYLKVGLELVRGWEDPAPLVLVVDDRAVRRSLARNLARDDGVDVRVIGSRWSISLHPSRNLLGMLARRAVFLFKESTKIIESRRMIPHPYVATEPTTLLISSVSSRNIHLGAEFHSYFFGELADSLSSMGHRVALVPIILQSAQYKNALRQLHEGPYPLLVLHRHLNFLDLLRAVLPSLKTPPLPRPFIPLFCGMDVSLLVKEELRNSWIGDWDTWPLLITAVVRRWAASGSHIDRIIYVYENQPWERALCWEARRSLPKTTLVGYQHSRAPRLLLSLYLAPGGEKDAPLPDRVVTAGKHTAKLFCSDGHDPDRVRLGGAFRMQDFFALRQRAGETEVQRTGSMVLVATSSGLQESVEVVKLAVGLFDAQDDIRVVIKCHTLAPFQKINTFLGDPLPKHVDVSEEPITDLMLKSSVMVYTDSTVCIEALAIGLPVVHLRPQFGLDLDPLEAAPEARLEATGQEELRQKVQWLLDHREEYINRHRDGWRDLVDEMFEPVTEQTFRAFID